MKLIIKKTIASFFILGIFLTLPSFASASPDQIEYQGNTATSLSGKYPWCPHTLSRHHTRTPVLFFLGSEPKSFR